MCADSIRDGERISDFSRRDTGSLSTGFGLEAVELFLLLVKTTCGRSLNRRKETDGFVLFAPKIPKIS